MGWDFPWYSSFGSSFNYDYQATSDAKVTPVTYNYHEQKEIEARSPLHFSLEGEQQGISVFMTKYGKIFHAYSSYARGVEKFQPTYQMLDVTPLGRQEEGPIPGIIADFKHHDKYPAEVTIRS
jgi:predicted dithiol-disulfide oxidoreductase (DUF899 family)